PAVTSFPWRELPGRSLSFLQEHSDAVLLVYGAGLLFFFARLLGANISLRRLRRRGLLPPDERWTCLMASAQRKLGIRRKVSLA
ncbi:hypothetical protein OFO30_36255, partial [Escherichia coli]|nr:hypothetical protein [Escherichia coli]